MKNTSIKEKAYKFFYLGCLVFSFLAAVKMLLAGFCMDEEYVLVMSYRHLIGDDLLGTMWEPHQTSTFLNTLLMRPYYALFGTDGMLLYLRFCGTLIHLAISVFFSKTLGLVIDKRYAFWLGLIYFNTIPKLIMLPEFGIMSFWFATLIMIFQLRLDLSGQESHGYAILMGVMLCGEILSYPSMIILFPFYAGLLLYRSRQLHGRSKLRTTVEFSLTCFLGGAIYVGAILVRHSIHEVFDNVRHILDGTVTYDISIGERAKILLYGIGKIGFRTLKILLAAIVLYYVGYFILRLLGKKVSRNGGEDSGTKERIWNPETRKKIMQRIFLLAIMLGFVWQLYYWVLKNYGYDTLQIHLSVLLVVGMLLYAGGRKTKKAFLFFPGAAASLLSIFSIMLFTDLSVEMSVPQFCLAAFLFVAALPDILADEEGKKRLYMMGLLGAWCITALAGKGFTMRYSGFYNNAFQSGGIMMYGPAKFCVNSYIGAYIYNRDYEDWQQYIKDGDRVLIVVDQLLGPDTVQYMFKDVSVSHYSIVNPTAYDERLEEYWELYPEKAPNVIIVDCWYGDIYSKEDKYVYHYIEENFENISVTDGRYIRIFRDEGK